MLKKAIVEKGAFTEVGTNLSHHEDQDSYDKLMEESTKENHELEEEGEENYKEEEERYPGEVSQARGSWFASSQLAAIGQSLSSWKFQYYNIKTTKTMKTWMRFTCYQRWLHQ